MTAKLGLPVPDFEDCPKSERERHFLLLRMQDEEDAEKTLVEILVTSIEIRALSFIPDSKEHNDS